jgi:hypothetical protein
MKSEVSSRSREPRQSDLRRRKFSAEGLERLRVAALANRPWEKACGPISPKGKRESAKNGRYRQRGEKSRRELRVELAGVMSLIHQMGVTRRALMRGAG